ncbi:MAG: FHA domain-containing protein [Acidobacteria bacterium]|nr:MAG: FHA domain-containing protein [Acidobacteriota bacterium]REK03272.1 MAG: FHA domain-containing protein [Acidobacteriota bacterium]
MPRQLRIVELDQSRLFALNDGEYLIGSGPDADIRLPHPTVSRRHALLRVQGGSVTLEDLRSTNGTRVDGTRVVGTHPVDGRSRIAIGSLDASLEEVAAADLEAAVRFEASSSPPNELALLSDTATASVGSLKVFTLQKLPPLVALLSQSPEAIEIAQAGGEAVLTSLPCTAVEISRRSRDGDDGLLFAARGLAPAQDEGSNGEHDSNSVDVELEQDDYRIRATFRHPVQARSFEVLIRMVLELVALADRRRLGRSTPRRAASEPPPMPQPPTLTPAVEAIYRDAARIGRGKVSVLITGESGTGKEILARFIHRASPRGHEDFIALNCAALPRDLLEAELFGVDEGVATGVHARPGKFEQAHGATLFLDEIGDMEAATQAKILRVLQEGEVYRLGARKPRPAEVRVVAATNQDVEAQLASGEFRADLYHRIADWRVELPPLRERTPDIANLAAWFLQREAERLGTHVSGISRGALDALLAFHWPGNIRQLEREMARAALFLEDGEMLQSRHLQSTIRAAVDDPALGAATTLPAKIEALERREICAALEVHGGNLSAVARDLGIARSTLYRRIEELDLGELAER